MATEPAPQQAQGLGSYTPSPPPPPEAAPQSTQYNAQQPAGEDTLGQMGAAAARGDVGGVLGAAASGLSGNAKPSSSAVPQDAFSGLTDPLRQAASDFAKGDYGSVAGDIVGGYSQGTYNRGRDIQGQAIHDQIHYGDPYHTIGKYDLQGIAQDPSKVLSALPLALETLGGPHGPDDPSEGVYDFYNKDPEARARADALYDQTGDIGVYVDLYEENQHRTLASGGIGGAARGLVRGIGTDVGLVPVGLTTGLAGRSAELLSEAGKVGMARGVMVAEKGLGTLYDPTDLALAGAGRLAQKAPGIFGPTESTKRAIDAQALGEMIQPAADSYRTHRDVTGMTQNPTLASAPPPPGPVAAPAPAPAPVPVPFVGPPPNMAPGPAALPAVAGAGQSFPPLAPPGPIPLGTGNLRPIHGAGGRFAPNPATPVHPHPIAPPGTVANPPRRPAPLPKPKISLAPKILSSTPALGDRYDDILSKGIAFQEDAMGQHPAITWDDGSPITKTDMDAAYAHMVEARPGDFLPTDKRFSWWTRMRSAMTSSGYMYDDWPSSKRERFGAKAPASVTAGERFHDLTTSRIRIHGDTEVQKLLDAYQERAVMYPDGAINMSNRAIALKEALEAAKYERPVEISHPGDTIRYVPENARSTDVMKGQKPVVITTSPSPPRSSPGEDDQFFDRMLIARGGEKNTNLREDLRGLLHDPSGFAENSPYSKTRQQMYKTGQVGPEPYWAKPNSTLGKKFPAAVGRYQEFNDRWKQNFPDLNDSTPGPATAAFEADLARRNQVRQLQQQFDNQQTYDVLRRAMDDMGLHDVELRVGDQYLRDQFGTANPFGGVRANAQFQRLPAGKMAIAVGLKFSRFPDAPMEDLLHLLDHEAIHALRALEVINDSEWRTLVLAARQLEHPVLKGSTFRQAVDITHKKSGYVMTNMDLGDEEAVAAMFASHGSGLRNMQGATPILQKVFFFFQRIVHYLRGTDAESVMSSIRSGQVGNRPRTLAGGGKLGIHDDVLPPGDEMWTIPQSHEDYMAGLDQNRPITWRGAKIPVKNMIGVVTEELDEGRSLAQKGILTPKENKRLVSLEKEYGDFLREPLSKASDRDLNRAASLYIPEQWLKSAPKGAPRTPGALSEIGKVVDDVASFRRIVGLSNYAAAPRQTLQQYLGNAVALMLASPGDLASYSNFKQWIKTLKSVRTEGKIMTDVQASRVQYGLPYREYRINQNIIRSTDINKGFFDKVSHWVAPQVLRDVVSTSDVFARDVVEGGVWRKGIKQALNNLPKAANARAAEWRNKGLMIGNVDREINDILTDYTPSGSKAPVIKPAQLEEELRTRLSGRGLDADLVHSLSNRIGRDWADSLNTIDNAAVKKGNDIFFTWDDSNLDQAISKVFLYHYWATHASGLYARSFANKPWLFGAFYRVGEQMMAEAEEGDYPDWLKGFTRVMNTAAGSALWFSPIDMFSTAYFLADWQYGGDPNAFAHDLTWLGQARNMSFFVMSPLVDYFLWGVGAYGGEDAKVPQNLSGLDRLTTLGSSVLNHLGYSGVLGDFHSDGHGNFIPFEPRPLTDIANALGVALGRPNIDPYAGQAANAKGFLQDYLLQEHPEWATDPNGSDLLVQAMNDEEQAAANGNPSQMWLDAERDATELNIEGPMFPGLPEPLRDIVSVGARLISPVRMTSQSSTKIIRQHPDMAGVIGKEAPAVGAEDQYDEYRVTGRPFDTLEAAQLAMDVQGYYEQGDKALGDAIHQRNAIGYGSLADGEKVTIAGQDYTAQDLAGMDETARWNLASDWMNAQGYAQSDIQAYYDGQDQYVAEHPQVGQFLAYREYIKSYDGGIEQFTHDALLSSPSFARYMERTGLEPGTEDFYSKVDNEDAFLAIQGQPTSIYDPSNLPDQGNIPGMYPGANPMQFNEQNGIGQSSGSADWDSFVSDVSDDVANIWAGQQVLDELFGPGVYTAGEYIPGADYKTAIAEFKARGIYVPKREDADIAYGYFDWLPNNASAPGHEIVDYLDTLDLGSGSGAELSVPTPGEIASRGGYEIVDTGPTTSTQNYQTAKLSDPIPLRTGPSQNNPSSLAQDLPAGISVRIVTRKNGWTEVMVLGMDEAVGWVPDGFLVK